MSTKVAGLTATDYHIDMNKQVGRSGAIFAGLLLPILGSLLLTEPAFAPTKEIRILGANITEQQQMANLISYDLSPAEANGVEAASYLVEDYSNKQILTGKHIDNSLPIASLTKLMTVWTVLEHAETTEIVTISDTDLIQVSPSLGLIPGDQVLVKDLLEAVLIGSANDASNVLGGYISRKVELPFGELMNQEAVELGMKNSRFSNPIGFDSVVNYSSARDLAILVHRLDERGLFAQSAKATKYEFTSKLGNQYSIIATNKLTNLYPDLQAVKTGYTNLALGAMINFLETPKGKLLLIVIGSPDRENDTLRLRKQYLER